MENIGIYAEHISKSFGKETVLRDINLSISPGKVVGVVGNNGCGKTVLMKCICGFMYPDSGSVIVNGKKIGKECDFPESLGIIIETPGFIPDMSGYRNLKTLASLRSKIGKAEILDTLERVGLSANRNKAVSKYSLGMRQRLGIAQAIMENPDALILDEPFNGLDRETVVKMRELLKQLKESGKAIMLASHNAQDIAELCDEVFDMEEYKHEMAE